MRCGASNSTCVASLATAACKRAAPVAALGGQEAGEDEPGAEGVARRADGGHRAAGARNRHHAVAGRADRRDERGARVRHRGRAGVADVGHPLPCREQAAHARRGLRLVVLVQREQRLVQPQVAQQRAAVRVSSQATASASASTWIARSVRSARLPIGVATTYSVPAGYCCAPAAAAAVRNRLGASMVKGASGGTGKGPVTTKAVGDGAEARALRHLQQQGLALVERNYRVARGPGARAGEVDLVMRERDGTLVFVEVRARAGAAHGGAASSVTSAKQRRIVFAAQHYLMRLTALPPCRFDVVAVEGGRIEWIRAAFDAA